MEIPEVPIEPPRKKKIRASRKVLASTEQYLNDNGLSFDQLTPAQQTFAVKYIKTKRGCLWYFLITFVGFIFLSVVCYMFYKNTVKDAVNSFMPDRYVVEAEDGSKVTKDVNGDLQERIQMYGAICSLLAGVFIAAIYTAASGLGTAIGGFFSVRKDRKVLEAFLPSVRKALKSETSSNG